MEHHKLSCLCEQLQTSPNTMEQVFNIISNILPDYHLLDQYAALLNVTLCSDLISSQFLYNITVFSFIVVIYQWANGVLFPISHADRWVSLSCINAAWSLSINMPSETLHSHLKIVRYLKIIQKSLQQHKLFCISLWSCCHFPINGYPKSRRHVIQHNATKFKWIKSEFFF